MMRRLALPVAVNLAMGGQRAYSTSTPSYGRATISTCRA